MIRVRIASSSSNTILAAAGGKKYFQSSSASIRSRNGDGWVARAGGGGCIFSCKLLYTGMVHRPPLVTAAAYTGLHGGDRYWWGGRPRFYLQKRRPIYSPSRAMHSFNSPRPSHPLGSLSPISASTADPHVASAPLRTANIREWERSWMRGGVRGGAGPWCCTRCRQVQ